MAKMAATAERAVLHAPLPGAARPSTVACLWFSRLPGPLTEPAYLVEERVQWEADRRPNVTRFSFLQRAGGMTREEFSLHWRDRHTPLARRHHPCLVRYVQNVVLDVLGPGAPELDGIAELGVERAEDFIERMYDSAEGRAIVAADVRSFIDLSAGWSVVTH